MLQSLMNHFWPKRFVVNRQNYFLGSSYYLLEIFVEEENVKKVLYSGKSEKEIIKEGRNVLSLTLKKVLSDDKDNGDDVDDNADADDTDDNASGGGGGGGRSGWWP